MAWCEKFDYVEVRSDCHFRDYIQSEEPELSGIYRCVGCGDCNLEIVHKGGTALPDHQQQCGNKPIWRLIVFPAHPDYYPCKTFSRRRK